MKVEPSFSKVNWCALACKQTEKRHYQEGKKSEVDGKKREAPEFFARGGELVYAKTEKRHEEGERTREKERVVAYTRCPITFFSSTS